MQHVGLSIGARHQEGISFEGLKLSNGSGYCINADTRNSLNIRKQQPFVFLALMFSKDLAAT
jgi:hypothetical protein